MYFKTRIPALSKVDRKQDMYGAAKVIINRFTVLLPYDKTDESPPKNGSVILGDSSITSQSSPW